MPSFGKPVSLNDVEYQYVPYQIPKIYQHKMKAMMIEAYVLELKDGKDRTESVIKNIKAYAKEKHIELRNVTREYDEEGKNDVLRCFALRTEGTIVFKAIKQPHLENYTGIPSDEEEILF